MERYFSKVAVILISGLFCCSALAVATESSKAGESTRVKTESTRVKTESTIVKTKTQNMKPVKARPGAASPIEKAELAIDGITISPGHPQVGNKIDVYVRVWNIGKKRSTMSSLNLKLRPGTIYMTNSSVLAFNKTVTIGAIDPNRARSVTFTTTITNWPTGAWTAEARVDPQNQVSESNEKNNVGKQGFTIH